MLKKVSRNAHFPALAFGSLLLVLILAIGTVGYMVIGQDHVTWVDSFYMTFITVATIGDIEVWTWPTIQMDGHTQLEHLLNNR